MRSRDLASARGQATPSQGGWEAAKRGRPALRRRSGDDRSALRHTRRLALGRGPPLLGGPLRCLCALSLSLSIRSPPYHCTVLSSLSACPCISRSRPLSVPPSLRLRYNGEVRDLLYCTGDGTPVNGSGAGGIL